MVDWKTYAIHDDKNIKGFFGDFRWLSNFHLCPINFCGYTFAATENPYMAWKTKNEFLRKQFETLTPKEAKKLGRNINLRDDWSKIKNDVMYAVNIAKYTQNDDLRKLLVETGNKHLEETNHWGDVYWGVCNGVGENNLGKILMKIREIIK